MYMFLAYVSLMNNGNSNEEQAMQTIDLGNNETISRGVIAQADGTFLALTFSKSKTFKTAAGARRWFAKNTNKEA